MRLNICEHFRASERACFLISFFLFVSLCLIWYSHTIYWITCTRRTIPSRFPRSFIPSKQRQRELDKSDGHTRWVRSSRLRRFEMTRQHCNCIADSLLTAFFLMFVVLVVLEEEEDTAGRVQEPVQVEQVHGQAHWREWRHSVARGQDFQAIRGRTSSNSSFCCFCCCCC